MRNIPILVLSLIVQKSETNTLAWMLYRNMLGGIPLIQSPWNFPSCPLSQRIMTDEGQNLINSNISYGEDGIVYWDLRK